jgi:hypothetical protein
MGFMSRDLAAKGYGVLAINTRQSDERVNTDNFVEVRRDIEAAVYVARALGTAPSCSTGTALAASRCSITPPTIGSRISRPW